MRILRDGPSTLPRAEGPAGSTTDASTRGGPPTLGVRRLDIRPGWFHLARPGVAERLIRPLLDDDTGPVRAPGPDIDHGLYLPVPPWEVAVYRVTLEGRTRVGLVLEVALAGRVTGPIRAREASSATTLDVLADQSALRGIDVAPVTLAHRPDREVSLALAEVTGRPAGFAETSRDGSVHEVWLVETERLAPVLDRLAGTGSVDILDGHRRCAAAARLAPPEPSRPDRAGPGRDRARHALFAFVVGQDRRQPASHHPSARGADAVPAHPQVPAGLFLRERAA